jgi:hypothetical protein
MGTMTIYRSVKLIDNHADVSEPRQVFAPELDPE